ncbi:MAG TPA: hypothetical protein VGI60_11845 [Chthoniobacterales bacterium]|jgi:propanediol utilization protein
MCASASIQTFALATHIDTNEANAANLKNGAQGFVDGVQHEQ